MMTTIMGTMGTMEKSNNNSGFTLIELVLTLALVGIVAVAAVPKVNTAEQTIALDGATRSVESDLKYAQNLASVTGQVHGFKIANDSLTYTVYAKDDNGVKTAVTSPHDKTPMQINIEDHYQTVSFVVGQQIIDIEFNANGIPADGQDVQFDLTNPKGDIKTISVSGATGHIDTTSTPAP